MSEHTVEGPIDYTPLLSYLTQNELAHWADILPAQINAGLSLKRFGDLAGWYQAMAELPAVTSNQCDFNRQVRVGHADELTHQQQQTLEQAFRKLIPWRKGPFDLFGLKIDTEWRSDWKWDRLEQHIANLDQRRVLDVGCGSGYHCWRMHGAGAEQVIGIEPSPRFVVQFYMVKALAGNCAVDVLPIGIESLPPKLEHFDTTFSMGVLYHRRSPMDHLLELRDTLRPGGELVLETLVIEGKEGEVLVPHGRYGKMNNVWFIPSVPTLTAWLEKCGYENARCVDCSQTTTDEQRATDWMKFQSLEDFLEPTDPSLTVEGHPAPKRAIILANKKL